MSGALRLILGDHLCPGVSSLGDLDRDNDTVLMAEVASEATYVAHHKKKIALTFAAMRNFAAELEQGGVKVRYVSLTDADNSGSLFGETKRFVETENAQRVVVTEPGEHRLARDIASWRSKLDRPVEVREDRRFICSHDAFEVWAEGRSELRLEYFYRHMRKHPGLLMDGEHPCGGRWNFDSDNRQPSPRDLFMPRPLTFAPNATTRAVLDLVGSRFPGHFGDLEPFWFATNRAQAEAAFEHFLAEALPHFGAYQDAMFAGEPFLYHGVISAYINLGLLDSLQVCRRAEEEYRAGRAPLNSVEGFVRQILGWREFVRGIYWREGDDYVRRNHLNATRPLPTFYWSAETPMNCLAQVIAQTKREAYAHHIQRLMVTGNFAMLAGVDPHEVHEWYLAVYVDAYEWVEAPNTIGMSQFADGGVVGTKPYAASGAYIDRMSDYCKSCAYDPKRKNGPDACPLNYLYWDFLARNEKRLSRLPRLAHAYRTLARFDDDRRRAIAQDATTFLEALS